MQVSKILIAVAALLFAVGTVSAQSPRAQGPKTRPAQAQGPKGTRPTQAQGPKTERPTQAQGPKADRGDQSEQSARGNQEDRSIAEGIARNPQQEARLKAMLPEGMTLEQAAEGFRNQGQFIAALNASKNQNIPFADLKAKMTGDNPLSLGQAINELRPEPTTSTTTSTTTTTTSTPATNQ